ncbi:MAG: carbon storage regulator [Gemmatales bacterium]|nr:MAG: carbon storage regulator [Gemmatales bacterium]
MLVLSRNVNQQVVFPDLEVAIKIVKAEHDRVKLGIKAPSNVRVFREELLAANPELAGKKSSRHEARNSLNTIAVGLALLRRQLEAAGCRDALATLNRIEDEVRSFSRQETEQSGQSEPPAKSKNRQRMLLVEDDQNERELLAGFLRMAGFDVDTAGDGTDALDYLRGHLPNAVLLDMIMPRCDGLTTVKKIRERYSRTQLKIFAVTGHTPEELGCVEQQIGIDRWFRKPLDPQQLLSTLRNELIVV